MEREYVRLTEALTKMEVNSVLTAQELTGLSRAEIIDFVRKIQNFVFLSMSALARPM